jgi:pyrroline-5-carboxylate reductase
VQGQNISFIGSGNLAWHLAPALENSGFVVKEVYSRNARHAEALTGRLYQAKVKASLDFSTSPSSVFIIAVNDESINEIAREIIVPDEAILAHTSGGIPLTDLQFAATPNIGVFYPLQTFTKSKKVDFKQTPIFVESANE